MIQIPDRSWQDMGLLPPQTIRAFKGVNTLDKFSIDPSFATRMSNLTGGSAFPALKTRQGTTLVGAALPARVTGLSLWQDKELHAIAGGTWYRFTGGTWNSLVTGLSTTATAYFVNFKGDLPQISLLMTNGVDAARYYNGTTVQTLNGIPAGVNFIDQHDGRVFAVKGNTVSHSALRKAQDWTALDDSGQFEVETENGELINGIKAGTRHLMIFKPSSFHELWGTSPLNFQLQTISTDIGLLNNNAIAVVQGTPYWADSKAVYSYGGSIPRKDFSTPIKGYIDGMNLQQTSKVSAGASGNSFYLSIPYGTATEPDTVLEYDTIFQVWYVYKNMSPTVFCDYDNVLHFGDTAGNIFNITGTTDNGAAIPFEWVSPPIGSGALSQRAQWYRLWYVCDVPAGSTLNLYLSKEAEGEDWTLVKTIVGSDLQTGRVIIPLNSVANANWVRVRVSGSGPVQISELDYQRRELPMM